MARLKADQVMRDLRHRLERTGMSNDEVIGSVNGILTTSQAVLSAALVECVQMANSIDPSVSGRDACLMLAEHFKKELAVFTSAGSLFGTAAEMAAVLERARQY